MFELALGAVLLGVGYFVGSAREQKHFESIKVREKELLSMPVRPDKNLDAKTVEKVELVTASVVIAGDYFKTVASSLKSMIGGALNSQETLIDRARREAILRLKEKTKRLGADEIIGLRIETMALDQMGVEVMVYGNAVYSKRS
jgi:uncharacterized protein YbjQ (UPF0145 family)